MAPIGNARDIASAGAQAAGIDSEIGDRVLAIVAYDAGGAEILSSFVRERPGRYVFVLAGPAVDTFRRKLGTLPNVSVLEALEQADMLLCGSGWQSELELSAIGTARALCKRSICWLDHWANYRARFERHGQLVFPDELWVSDEYSLGTAKKEIPEVPARLQENPYIKELRSEFGLVTPSLPLDSNGSTVLYVCEPTGEHALKRYGDSRHWGYDEFDALRYFISHVDALGQPIARILVRPHPAEAPNKYDDIARESKVRVLFSPHSSLLADLASSDYVVGCNSMALVVALSLGKRVISCIPPGGAPCSLPHKGIERFEDILRRSGEEQGSNE
jgi:hypothetical protein